MQSFIKRHPVLSYLLLAYLWTWGFALPLMMSRRGWIQARLSENWEIVAAFGPLVAALLVVRMAAGLPALRELLGSMLRWRVGAPGLLLACASPFLLLALAVLAVGIGTPAWPQLSALEQGRLATAAGWIHLLLVAGLVQGLGEEPGWRGFLLPRLRGRFTPLKATALLFPVWLLWHLPAFLGRPEFGLAQFAAFSVGIFSAAVWLTLIMEMTGSVLMAVAWHALINVVRGVALGISMPLFLGISALVTVGALLICVFWLYSPARDPVSARD